MLEGVNYFEIEQYDELPSKNFTLERGIFPFKFSNIHAVMFSDVGKSNNLSKSLWSN